MFRLKLKNHFKNWNVQNKIEKENDVLNTTRNMFECGNRME